MISLDVSFIQQKANAIRVSIIEMLLEAGSGHTAGPLGMADIFALMYFHVLTHDPKNPTWVERDILVLSNGHICPGQYAAMAHAGYFPIEELKTLRKLHSRLQGHPHREMLPGVETSSGPLGTGLSEAIGMALADRLTPVREERFIYAFLGDGECNCGSIWEAAMLAGKEHLDNLIAIVDRNDIQIDGFTHDIMPLEPFASKWESFGWHVQTVDGHDIAAVNASINEAKAVQGRPSIIIALTIPGKGVKAFEKDYRWHGKPPSKEEGVQALKELRSLAGVIRE